MFSWLLAFTKVGTFEKNLGSPSTLHSIVGIEKKGKEFSKASVEHVKNSRPSLSNTSCCGSHVRLVACEIFLPSSSKQQPAAANRRT